MSTYNDNEVKLFWNWFSDNCSQFWDSFDNAELITELDERVSRLGEFSWEIGPGVQEKNAFVLSPNGDRDLLEITRAIVAASQKCSGWEYYYAKPVKDWDFIFDFENADGEDIEVDASQWEYVLLQHDNGMFDIVIKALNIWDFEEDDMFFSAEVVLDSVLGEEMRIMLIHDIEIVKEFEEGYKQGVGEIRLLLEHIQRSEL